MEFHIGPTNWSNELVFDCLDEDVGTDDLIGQCTMSVLDFMTEKDNAAEFKEEGMCKEVEDWFKIFQNKGKKESGEVQLKIQFFPAGLLTITSVEARNLFVPRLLAAAHLPPPRAHFATTESREGQGVAPSRHSRTHSPPLFPRTGSTRTAWGGRTLTSCTRAAPR